jgi:hypothetical protein
MKKIFTLLSLSVALVFTAEAQKATYGWALGGGGATGSDYAADVVTDASGNIFFAGSFVLGGTFNGVTLAGSAKGSGAADKSLWISKLSPDKTNLWNIYSNVGVVNPAALATTAAGDLIVTGSIRAVKGGATDSANIVDAAGNVTIFPNLGNATSFVQSFVAKFNSNGTLQWVKELNSSSTKDTLVETTGLTTDANGDVYVTGSFARTVLFSASTPITLTSANTGGSAFIAKLSGTTGDAVWAKTSTGGIASETLNGLAYGDDGYLYVAGNYKNATTPVATSFGGLSFTPSITPDIVLIKLDTNGNVSYLQERPALAINTKGDARVKELIVKNGKAFVGGSFQGSYGGIQFTGSVLSSTAAYLNGFVAAFQTSNGGDLWQKVVASPAISEVNGLGIGYDNNVYAFGYEYNALGTAVAAADCVFGNGFVLTDAANTLGNLFLVSYDTLTGTTKEVHWAGKGTGSEVGNAMTSFGDKLYLAGTTGSSSITFENGTDTYTRFGYFDFVLESYTVSATPDALENQKALSAFAYFDKTSQTIVIKNAENTTSVKVFDTTGRLVSASAKGENTSSVNVQGIQSGIYLIQTIDTDGQRASYKLSVN